MPDATIGYKTSETDALFKGLGEGYNLLGGAELHYNTCGSSPSVRRPTYAPYSPNMCATEVSERFKEAAYRRKVDRMVDPPAVYGIRGPIHKSDNTSIWLTDWGKTEPREVYGKSPMQTALEDMSQHWMSIAKHFIPSLLTFQKSFYSIYDPADNGAHDEDDCDNDHYDLRVRTGLPTWVQRLTSDDLFIDAVYNPNEETTMYDYKNKIHSVTEQLKQQQDNIERVIASTEDELEQQQCVVKKTQTLLKRYRSELKDHLTSLKKLSK